jgi:hypothetical protein
MHIRRERLRKARMLADMNYLGYASTKGFKKREQESQILRNAMRQVLKQNPMI